MTCWFIFLVIILTLSYYIPNLFSSTNYETNHIISLVQPKTLQSVTNAIRMRSKFVNMMCIIWPTPPSHPSFLPSFKLQSSHAEFFLVPWNHQVLFNYRLLYGLPGILFSFSLSNNDYSSLRSQFRQKFPWQAFPGQSVWVWGPAVNSQTPHIFPIKSHFTINACLHVFVFP